MPDDPLMFADDRSTPALDLVQEARLASAPVHQEIAASLADLHADLARLSAKVATFAATYGGPANPAITDRFGATQARLADLERQLAQAVAAERDLAKAG